MNGCSRFLLFLLIITSNSPKSFAQHDPRFEKIQNYFSFEELILGSWELVQLETEIAGLVKIDSVLFASDSIKIATFRFGSCFSSNYRSKQFIVDRTFRMRPYHIVKDSADGTMYLHFSEKDRIQICHTFEIEDFSFNRLVLVQYSPGQDQKITSIKRTYQRSDNMEDRSIGTWLHFGNFGIYNLADTDSVEHHFFRVLRGQDTRDTLDVGAITFQLEFLANQTYFSFKTGGVLGSVNLGKYRIDLLNQQLFFFETDYLVYDYYFKSNMELVLKLNQDLSALKELSKKRL